jgi:hypothetical protein
MYGTRNINTSVSACLRIALIALLLGSGCAAISPGSSAPTGGSGEPVATGGFQLTIHNEGNLILYGERGSLPLITSGEP